MTAFFDEEWSAVMVKVVATRGEPVALTPRETRRVASPVELADELDRQTRGVRSAPRQVPTTPNDMLGRGVSSFSHAAVDNEAPANASRAGVHRASGETSPPGVGRPASEGTATRPPSSARSHPERRERRRRPSTR